jgi:hypothetical protein
VVDPTAPPGLLATSSFTGDGLAECVAGERAFFEVTLKDAEGREPPGWEVRCSHGCSERHSEGDAVVDTVRQWIVPRGDAVFPT